MGLEGIHDTIDPVLGLLLDGLDGWLSNYIDISNDMAAEFANEMASEYGP